MKNVFIHVFVIFIIIIITITITISTIIITMTITITYVNAIIHITLISGQGSTQKKDDVTLRGSMCKILAILNNLGKHVFFLYYVF